MYWVREMSDVDQPNSDTDHGYYLQHTCHSISDSTEEKLYIETTLAVLTFDSCSPNSSSFICSGVLISSSAAIWSRILPICVFSPVPTTTPLALPEATLVPWSVGGGRGKGGVYHVR